MRPRIACIGTREIVSDERRMLEEIGAWLVSMGYIISTGNALGSDQAFARGGNSVNPAAVELWLPWESYERAARVPGNVVHKSPQLWMHELSQLEHPAWDRLSQGARRLHARNAGIVKGCTLVVALPGLSRPGGTGQGMRLAKRLGIPVRNLRDADDLKAVLDKVRGS